MATPCDYQVKLVMLGNSGVGKTSIVHRYSKSQFPEAVRSTVYTDFIFKNVTFDDKVLRAEVWDTAGQERYRVVTSAYYRKAAGALLVYDITDRKSFSGIDVWLEEVKGHMALTDLELILIGNKADRETERQVTREQGQALADQHGFAFLETSAKTALHIEEAFSSLLLQIYEKRIKAAINGTAELPTGVKDRNSASGVLRKKECRQRSHKCCLS